MNINVTKRDGTTEPLDTSKITASLKWAADSKYEALIPNIEVASKLHFYEGIPTSRILDIVTKTADDLVSVRELGYDTIARNLKLQRMYKEVFASTVPMGLFPYFRAYNSGICRKLEHFSREDRNRIAEALDHSRDFLFTSAGLSSLESKYMNHDTSGKVAETPQLMFMSIAVDIFSDYHKNPTDYIISTYHALSTFKITLPTPEMRALRNGNSNYASCALLKIGDSIKSWKAADNAIVDLTVESAGVGVDVSAIASIGEKVKNGHITHGGKLPTLRSIDANIQKTTQEGRRGSATPFINFYDAEILSVLAIKSPRTEVSKRINDLSYGIKLRDLVYERAQAGRPISLFNTRESASLYEVFHSGSREDFITIYERLESEGKFAEQIDAGYFLEVLNQECFENSSYYVLNIDEVNQQSPYTDTIYQSNVCVEEVSPTLDINPKRPHEPAVAICVLGNVNQGTVPIRELPEIMDLLVRAQTHIIKRQNFSVPQAKAYVDEFASIGLGISNHAYWLASNNWKYGEKPALHALDEYMEHFQYYAIKASMNIAKEIGEVPGFRRRSKYAKGIMPLDRYNRNVDNIVNRKPSLAWDTLRNQVIRYGMANTALTMIPPSESSSTPSNQTSSIEPIKDLTTIKDSSYGDMTQFAPEAYKLADKYDYAYATKTINERYFKHVAVCQKWIDKSISTNRFYNPNLYQKDLVPVKQLIRDLFILKKYGIKSLYYTNTYIEDVEQEKSTCQGGGCDV